MSEVDVFSGSSEVIAKRMVQPHQERCSDAINARAAQSDQGTHETHVPDAPVQGRSESTSERAEDKPTSGSRPKESMFFYS